jgi:ABC-2 type transport system ATP-binding protein
VTILLTTHILVEADRCDRLVLLHQGRVVAEGSPASLRRGPTTACTRSARSAG